MTLKTSYKADVFEGDRKYQISTDAQGKSETVDVTTCSQGEDLFKPEDINAATTEIDRMTREMGLALLVASWGDSAPYVQTVSIPGLRETDKVQMMSAIKSTTAMATTYTWDKTGVLARAGIAGNGRVTFCCPKKKPISDFNTKLVRMSINE